MFGFTVFVVIVVFVGFVLYCVFKEWVGGVYGVVGGGIVGVVVGFAICLLLLSDEWKYGAWYDVDVDILKICAWIIGIFGLAGLIGGGVTGAVGAIVEDVVRKEGDGFRKSTKMAVGVGGGALWVFALVLFIWVSCHNSRGLG